jgi:hypothetical protein
VIDVEVIETSTLGDRSYLASDGEVAFVVDCRPSLILPMMPSLVLQMVGM